MKISDALFAYSDEAQSLHGHSRFTLLRYRHAVRFLAQFTGARELSDLDAHQVRSFFVNGSAIRNWKPHTYRTYRRALVAFFRWCIGRQLLTENFAEAVGQPRVGVRLPRGLKRQQATDVLAAVSSHAYPDPYCATRARAVIATLLLAGLRRNELLNLESCDVDLEERTIMVRWGKRNKERIVPVCETLHEALRAFEALRTARGFRCVKFFTDLKGDRAMSTTGLRCLLRTAQEASGVTFSAHRLRHTFATLMLEGGCDLYALSKMLGHSDIKTTTIYLAASAQHLRSQISKHPLNSLPVVAPILA